MLLFVNASSYSALYCIVVRSEMLARKNPSDVYKLPHNNAYVRDSVELSVHTPNMQAGLSLKFMNCTFMLKVNVVSNDSLVSISCLPVLSIHWIGVQVSVWQMLFLIPLFILLVPWDQHISSVLVSIY